MKMIISLYFERKALHSEQMPQSICNAHAMTNKTKDKFLQTQCGKTFLLLITATRILSHNDSEKFSHSTHRLPRNTFFIITAVNLPQTLFGKGDFSLLTGVQFTLCRCAVLDYIKTVKIHV